MRLPFLGAERRLDKALYSRLSVDNLRAYTDRVVESTVKSTQRVALVDRLLLLVDRSHLQDFIGALVRDARTIYPGHNVDVNIMGAVTEVRLSDRETETIKIATFVPEEHTWCRYTVAAGKPLEIEDSLESLIVCTSPYTGQVRSYLGAPLLVRGWAVGVFCVYSGAPRTWGRVDRDRVNDWAMMTSQALEDELTASSHGQ